MTRASVSDRLPTGRRPPSAALAAGGVALVVGVATLLAGFEVLPYLSANHDEGVYLQQAELLLGGRLELAGGSLSEAVRPWFFVADGDRLYPKYTPYPAALYAIAMATVGEARLALAAVAAANVALVYGLGASAFDRRVGLVAAGAFALAPISILTAVAFLPYAPTTTLVMLFAWAYLRADRTGRHRTAAIAGAAIGLAFLARPYTAVLVAIPFVIHAGWRVASSVRARRPLDGPVTRNAVTGSLGLGFVGLTLAYNARMTGDPLSFPYEAFAPRDGVGFGRRAILGHAIDYTPEVAVRTAGWNLWYLLTRWGPVGALGTTLAGVGVLAAGRRVRRDGLDRRAITQGLLLGVAATTVVGNVAFWGNRNLLGTLGDPTDGLVSLFGPFYHLDVVWPLSIFAAAGLVAAVRWGFATAGVDPATAWADPRRRRAIVGIALVSAILLGVATAGLLAGPLERHSGYTDRYASAYEPFERTDLEDAVVELPTPYGPWLNHPFQSLRNEPDLGGPVVFAQSGGPDRSFDLAAAYPERELHRFTYRGEWRSVDPEPVIPRLERVRIAEGDRLHGRTTVGVPDGVSHYTVRLEVGDRSPVVRTVESVDDEAEVDWTIESGTVALDGPTGESIRLAHHDRVDLFVRLVEPDGSTLTYHQSMDVRSADGNVSVVWPPERRVCRLTDRCGTAGTYLPEHPDEFIDGVSFEVALEGQR